MADTETGEAASPDSLESASTKYLSREEEEYLRHRGKAESPSLSSPPRHIRDSSHTESKDDQGVDD